MKLALDLNNKVLMVPECHQATLLALLADCLLYTAEGYSDYTYNLSDEVPKLEYVKDSRINGLEAELEKAKKKAQEDSSKYYKLYNDKNNVEKELAEAKTQLEALNQSFLKYVVGAPEDLSSEQEE